MVEKIGEIGLDWHQERIFAHARANQAFVTKSLRDLAPPTGRALESAVVVSAGPSVHKFKVPTRLKEANYSGSVVAVDGSMIKCLQQGLIPDYVLSLDPHPSRIVRWFGDPDFEKNTENDDYFSRQDLDVDFRKNSILHNQQNLDLINRFAPQMKLILCTSAPANVVARALEAGFDIYWWNPLLDDPSDSNSLTRQLYKINPLPCLNTGGTVGTAAWVFAQSRLKVSEIAVTGMDLGYHMETPITHTQTFHELKEHVSNDKEFESLFVRSVFPLTGEEYYTDPTYAWYKRNMLQLLEKSTTLTYNCSGAGTLFGPGIELAHLDDFLKRHAQ